MPRDIASRAAKNVCDEGRGVGPGGLGVYLDFADAIKRLGRKAVEAKYGNLFDMYAQITGENPYETPMRIYPAVHYTMGGLWVDYDLQSTIPGLFVAGEANFSDHGANRLGRQCLDAGAGRRLLRAAQHDQRLPRGGPVPQGGRVPPRGGSGGDRGAAADRQAAVDQGQPDRRLVPPRAGPPDVGLLRDGALRGGVCARPSRGFASSRPSSGPTSRCSGTGDELNQALERAGRVADFFELGELMCIDALVRRESCGGHFRAESQTEDGEAMRHDDEFAYVSAWEFGGDSPNGGTKPILHKEPLVYEYVEMKQRSYK